MEVNFDNNVDSDNEIPACNFVMFKVLKSYLAKMTKKDERHFYLNSL